MSAESISVFRKKTCKFYVHWKRRKKLIKAISLQFNTNVTHHGTAMNTVQRNVIKLKNNLYSDNSVSLNLKIEDSQIK